MKSLKQLRQDSYQELQSSRQEGNFPPPGPRGGPGAGADKKPRMDKDNNPPGPRGGPGT
jgi:hypothetical protein